MIKHIKQNWATNVILIIMLAFGIYLLPYLPAQINTHWGINGAPDRSSSKEFAVFFLPILSILLNFFVYYLVALSPRSFQMKNSKSSINKIMLSLTCFLMSVYAGMLLTAYDPVTYRFATFFHIGTGLFLITAGNFMSKIEKNFFIGIRTPWTLTSELNWNKTHRFAAKCMVFAGFLILACSFMEEAFAYGVIIFISALLTPVFYSLWFYIKNERRAESLKN